MTLLKSSDNSTPREGNYVVWWAEDGSPSFHWFALGTGEAGDLVGQLRDLHVRFHIRETKGV